MTTEPSKDAFAERDDRETVLTYDKGGTPLYVIGAWVALIIAYVVYLAVYSLPDLQSWGGP